MFIDPDIEQIAVSAAVEAQRIELHTRPYTEATSYGGMRAELKRLEHATEFALSKGLIVNVCHGLNYQNVVSVAATAALNELNIGHSIIGRALFVGLKEAIREMKILILKASLHK